MVLMCWILFKPEVLKDKCVIIIQQPLFLSCQITQCLSQSWCPAGQGRASMVVVKLGWAQWCPRDLRVEGWELAWWSMSFPPRRPTNWIPASEKDPT